MYHLLTRSIVGGIGQYWARTVFSLAWHCTTTLPWVVVVVAIVFCCPGCCSDRGPMGHSGVAEEVGGGGGCWHQWPLTSRAQGQTPGYKASCNHPCVASSVLFLLSFQQPEGEVVTKYGAVGIPTPFEVTQCVVYDD